MELKTGIKTTIDAVDNSNVNMTENLNTVDDPTEMERNPITRYGSELPKAQVGFGFRGLPLAPIGTGLFTILFWK